MISFFFKVYLKRKEYINPTLLEDVYYKLFLLQLPMWEVTDVHVCLIVMMIWQIACNAT